LARNGFNFYLPKCRTLHQRVGLLFPRYIFAGPPEQWVALRQTWGVARLLRTGLELATVPDEALAALKAREDRKGLVRLPRPPKFRPGQKVRITLGAFTGLTGVYRGSKGSREWVELTLGQVTLPLGNLVAE
jgi:transcriptional antiterminator RfaH